VLPNVKTTIRGIAMNLPQLSHALESRGDANTYTWHINDVERHRRHFNLRRSPWVTGVKGDGEINP